MDSRQHCFTLPASSDFVDHRCGEPADSRCRLAVSQHQQRRKVCTGAVGPRECQPSSRLGEIRMLYAILCYHSEDVVGAWSQAEDDEVMRKLDGVHAKLARQGRLGPVARLLPTTAATTLRKNQDPPLVIDGP